MTIIQIPKSLRDYIERLNYEEKRYEVLLNTVEQSSMTEQEWLSSLEYFSLLYEETKLSKQFALQEIYDMYKNEIQSNVWHINFNMSAIIVGTIDSPSIDLNESYSDMIHRLYPSEKLEPIHMNDDGVKNVTFQVTQSCNMKCTYCYQHNKANHRMSFDTAKKIIDMLLEADEKTNTYITTTKLRGIVLDFIGGEPLLEIKLISQISQYFVNELFRRKHPLATKFMFSMSSNGLLYFEPEVQEYFNKYKFVLSYGVSIDGDKELHDTCRIDLNGEGTYDRAFAAVTDYRKNTGYMGSKMTISPDNVHKVCGSLKNMILNDYTNINLNCVYEEGWTKTHALILYNQLCELTDWLCENSLQDKITLSIFSENCGKPLDETYLHNWCGGTGLMLAFDYKGDAYPCQRYMETSTGNEYPLYIIGNLESGINQIEEHKNRISCLECITRRTQSTDECFYCPIAMGCAWCSAYNYEVFGTPDKRTTFICDMHKARSLANVYYWRKRGIDFPLNCPKEWAVEIIGEEEFNKLQNMGVE